MQTSVIDWKARTDETVRLDAWRAVFEKTNRIISEQPVTVNIIPIELVPARLVAIPGWSDGEAVNFNGPMVKAMLESTDPVSAVLRLKGLNYHELSHILYTPRRTDELPKLVIEKATMERDSTWWYAFNALEDQRIETWFAAKYGPSRRYFEAAVLQWLITKGNSEAAVLTYGRKYLSAKIRVRAGAVFRKKYGDALYDEFKQVIDDYLTVVLPSETMRGFALVTRYHSLLKRMQALAGAGCPSLPVEDNCGQAGRTPGRHDEDVLRKGRVSVKEAKDAKDKAEKDIDKAADADAEQQAEDDAAGDSDMPEDLPEDAAEPSDDGEAGDTEGDEAGDGPEGDAEGDQPGDTNGDGDDADQDGQGTGHGQGPDAEADGDQPGSGSQGEGTDSTPSDEDGGDSAGTGSAEHGVDTIEQVVADARDDLDDIQGDPDIQTDIEGVLDAIRARMNDGDLDAAGAKVDNRGQTLVTEEQQIAVRKIVKSLSRIRAELEAETLRRQVTGRVEPRRWISRQPHEIDIFKQYEEGVEEQAGIEAVVLLDVSSSMGDKELWGQRPKIELAAPAMWVMKRAFDRMEIRTTVMVYDTGHAVLYQPGEKADHLTFPILAAAGGTDPSTALEQAVFIFGKSQLPNKVLINITDGQWVAWGSPDNHEDSIARLKKMGVVSMLLGLDHAVATYGDHGHTEAHDVRSVKDLPGFALRLVARIQRNAARRR